jgi:hypothetical protein
LAAVIFPFAVAGLASDGIDFVARLCWLLHRRKPFAPTQLVIAIAQLLNIVPSSI